MVAGPVGKAGRLAGVAEVSDGIAVGIEEADVGDIDGSQAALASGFADEVLDFEHARLVVVLRPKQGRCVWLDHAVADKPRSGVA